MTTVFAHLPGTQARRRRLLECELAAVRQERMNLELGPPAYAEALLARSERIWALWSRELRLRTRLEELSD